MNTEQLNNLFHKSPTLYLFEEVYTQEFRDIGYCCGYCLEDGMLIYAIALKHKIVYLTEMEFNRLRCRAKLPPIELPSFGLYEKVGLVGIEGEYKVIGFELSAGGWLYNILYGETNQLMSHDELRKVVSV